MKRKSLKSFIYVSALLVFLSGFVGVSLFVKSEVVEATTIGDDYPVKWKNLPLGGAIDDWRMYTRYCTSFVAYRLSTANNFELPSGFGNADRWGTEAMARGYKVDKNPKVGSVAWWTSTHVAWVAEVSGDNVKVEEYNYGFDGKYNTRWINKNSANGYIHFKDMPQTPVGWYNNGHYDYYYYADGTKAIGLTWVGTKRYNFDKNGAMYKNAWTNSDKYSYYSTSDGSLAVGLTWVGTKRYNFDKNGAMYKNAWTNSDKYSYYSTSDGSLAVGLTWVGTKRYNFDKNGAMYKNAWTNSDKYSYYSTSDGSLAVGLTWVGTKRYNFDKNGAMYKNTWTSSDKYSYYSTSDGSLAVGHQQIGENKYIFDKNGALYKNMWVDLDGNRYYSKEDGALAIGEQIIDGITYMFDESGKLVNN